MPVETRMHLQQVGPQGFFKAGITLRAPEQAARQKFSVGETALRADSHFRRFIHAGVVVSCAVCKPPSRITSDATPCARGSNRA